jgi:hypothetical protein
MQPLFRSWAQLDHRPWSDVFLSPFKTPALGLRLIDLIIPNDNKEELLDKVRINTEFLEAIAVLLFAKATEQLDPAHQVKPDQRIDPYAVSLDPSAWERDGVFPTGGGLTLYEALEKAPIGDGLPEPLTAPELVGN